MQISACHPPWLHLRLLTLALLLIACRRFGAGQEAAGPSTISPADVAASGLELKIRPEYSSYTKPTGTPFVFTCEISGADRKSTTNYDLKWFHNSTEITDKSARIYIEDEGTVVLKLYIAKFEKQDEGVFKCTGVINEVQWEKSTTIFLFKDITFDHAPKVQHPAIYTDALIECVVSGRPTPEVSWRFKGNRIQTDGRYKIVDEGLRIANVTLDDDGLYLCRAEVESDGRYSEEPITVEVHIPPKIVEGFGTANAIEGGELSVFCRAEGLPAPEFQFYKIKDGVAIAVESSDRVVMDAKAGTLTFRPLKKEDEGKYSCRAHNDVGNETREGDVQVLVKPGIFDFQNVTNDEGETPTMICAARGDPAPTMTFRKAGNTSVYNTGNNNDERLFVSGPKDGRLSLKFNSLIPSDSGDYICRAESNIGSDEQTAKLTVKYRPRLAKDHPQLVHIWAGKTRNISCNVEGEPVPAIEWHRGNEVITNNSTYTTFNSDRSSNLQVTVLEADQIWIYGNYTCRASNELGTTDIIIELRRATAPDSPQSVNVTESLPNSILLQVEPPIEDGGEKVKGYRVEYSEKMQNTSVVIGGDVGEQPEYSELPTSLEVLDTDTITIENLKPNTTYMVRVKAKNDVGVSSPRELIVSTKPVQKPNPIQITPSSELEASPYTITWKKPITGGLPITEYKFQFRTVRLAEDGSGKKTFGKWQTYFRPNDVNKPMLSYALTELAPSTTYELEVLAKNDLGWSDPTPAFQFKTASLSDFAPVQASVNPGTVVGIVVVIFVVLLIVVDVSCYFVNHCGVTMCICVHLCGRSSAFTKEKAMEEGESKEVLKQPIETYQPEEGAADEQTQLPPPAYNELKEQCLKSDDDKEALKEKEELKEALKEGIESEKEKEKQLDSTDDVKVVSGTTEEKTEKAPAV